MPRMRTQAAVDAIFPPLWLPPEVQKKETIQASSPKPHQLAKPPDCRQTVATLMTVMLQIRARITVSRQRDRQASTNRTVLKC